MPSRSSAAVAGRIRSAQPAASSWNIVSDEHAVRPLGERAYVGVRRGLVARDDEELDRLRVRLVRVGRDGPAERDAARVGRAREVERAAAGLVLESELVRELRDARAAAAAGARPDEDGTLGARSFFASALAAPGELAAESRRPSPARSSSVPVGEQTTTSAPCRRASLIQRSTIGARSTTGSSPTTTTSSACAIAAQREAERLERVRGRLGEHGRVRVEAAAQESPERVRDLCRLGARERRHDRAVSPRGASTRPRRARRPTRSPRAPFARAGAAS